MTQLPISALRRDGGTQPRDHISLDVAKEYAEAIADGATLPPVTAFYDGTEYWLADGFHRIEAHQLLERNTIEVDVRQGDRRAAVLYSVGANAAHGYRRTNLDKRRAVVTLLNDHEWAGWSDRAIARACHVDGKLVAAMRPKDTAETRSEPTRIFLDRHGNKTEMRTGAIGKPKPLVAGRPRDFKPHPHVGKSEEVGIGEASAMIGLRHEKLVKIARAGEIDGAEKVAGNWRFDTAKLRAWADATPGETVAVEDTALPAEPATDPAPSPEPICTTSGKPLSLAMLDVIEQIAAWPSASDLLDLWLRDIGRGPDPEQVAQAATWMSAFAAGFPAVHVARRANIADVLERIKSDVVE